MTYDEIMAALKNGSDPEKMAQDFADTLNYAISQYNNQKKQEEEAAARRAAMRKSDTDNLLADVCSYLKVYYPSLYKAFAKINTDDFLEIMDAIVEELEKLEQTFASLGPDLAKLFAQEKQPEPQVYKDIKFTNRTNDPLKEFLRQNNL